ncbi:hypothetical protein [Hymenobacter psychrotolerans]|uniref:Uncharacterized protein n=1 Tax=Hymenobacter psychrotolerans DSM 18569 TaxID=1121959 RepID=A0A1M7E697_9BACT|nr:hypothetical protein [Hymenobacter psychrotolerans]SHL87196.1 hypothetical protein SAMN02746009_03528 [Hymenobacter psychrotolerans DSM 18569]
MPATSPTTASSVAAGASPYASLRLTAQLKARVYWATPQQGASQCDFYSFDSSGRYQVADPFAYGLRGLKKLVDKLGDKVARCVIYENLTPGRPEYCRKEKGSWNK